MDNLLQIGMGGMFAMLVIREVLHFLKRRNGYGEGEISRYIREAIRDEVAGLYEGQKELKEEVVRTRHDLRNVINDFQFRILSKRP